MKHIFIFLSLSLLFSQELEVEGDLKVTGTMESATIDSLNQVIANMQAQITELQAGGGWETRTFEFNYNSDIHGGGNYIMSPQEIFGYNLNNAEIRIAELSNVEWNVDSKYASR